MTGPYKGPPIEAPCGAVNFTPLLWSHTSWALLMGTLAIPPSKPCSETSPFHPVQQVNPGYPSVNRRPFGTTPGRGGKQLNNGGHQQLSTRVTHNRQTWPTLVPQEPGKPPLNSVVDSHEIYLGVHNGLPHTFRALFKGPRHRRTRIYERPHHNQGGPGKNHRFTYKRGARYFHETFPPGTNAYKPTNAGRLLEDIHPRTSSHTKQTARRHTQLPANR